MDEEAIRDIFREAGAIRLRRMFGGLGIYRDDLMFALESGGELYLKVDDTTVERFPRPRLRAVHLSGPERQDDDDELLAVARKRAG